MARPGVPPDELPVVFTLSCILGLLLTAAPTLVPALALGLAPTLLFLLSVTVSGATRDIE